jgi:hypothetical protein
MKLSFSKKTTALVVLVPAILFFIAFLFIPKDSKYSVPSIVNKVSTSACLRWTMHRDNEFKTDFFGMTYFGKAGNLVDAAIRCHGAHEKPFLFLMQELNPQVLLDLVNKTMPFGKYKGTLYYQIPVNYLE